MLKKSITKYIALRIETDKDLKITSEATGSALHGSTQVFLLGVLSLINDISHFLTLGIVLPNSICFDNGQLTTAHNVLNTLSQSQFCLF